MNFTLPSPHGSWSSLTDRLELHFKAQRAQQIQRVLAAEQSLETSLTCKARDQNPGEESERSKL